MHACGGGSVVSGLTSDLSCPRSTRKLGQASCYIVRLCNSETCWPFIVLHDYGPPQDIELLLAPAERHPRPLATPSQRTEHAPDIVDSPRHG